MLVQHKKKEIHKFTFLNKKLSPLVDKIFVIKKFLPRSYYMFIQICSNNFNSNI